jgi:hypothetical protein
MWKNIGDIKKKIVHFEVLQVSYLFLLRKIQTRHIPQNLFIAFHTGVHL